MVDNRTQRPLQIVSDERISRLVKDDLLPPKHIVECYSGQQFRCWLASLAPGRGYALHAHAADESFVILSGIGEIKDEQGNAWMVKPSAIVCIPAKTHYSIYNVGNERLVFCGSRAEAPGGAHIKKGE